MIVVGLGATSPTPEDLRRAAGPGFRQAAGLPETAAMSVAVSLGADEPETVQAVAEGALLGSYGTRRSATPTSRGRGGSQ